MTGAYYNEHDEYAARWLRNLIVAGHIAPGDVDTRDIRDVRPDDLRGYTQCHFFAGIGVWSYALRMAGWPDDRPVWTGSCPCQPFSAAGAGLGFADERHLWPHWLHLISERRPATVFGEQVASKDVDPWIDLVQDDMEALGHAFGAIAFPAASIGSPNIRDRTYWMAHAHSKRGRRHTGAVSGTQTSLNRSRLEDGSSADGPWPGRADGRMADTAGARLLSVAFTGIHRGEEGAGTRNVKPERLRCTRRMADNHKHGRATPTVTRLHDIKCDAESCRGAGGLADTDVDRLQGCAVETLLRTRGWQEGNAPGWGCGPLVEIAGRAGPTNGRWRDADWLLCRDGKWRPVEPGTFPLAHGATARVGRLRAYGNAVNAEAAIEFIRCADEAIKGIA